MPTYKVLVLNANQLERWETIEATDDLAAISAAPPCEDGGRIEVWRGDTRLARINCVQPG